MVNDKVKIIGTNEFKIISDMENIGGVDVFYMSDRTSYSKDQILFDVSERISLSSDDELCLQNLNDKQKKNLIEFLIPNKELLVKDMVLWFTKANEEFNRTIKNKKEISFFGKPIFSLYKEENKNKTFRETKVVLFGITLFYSYKINGVYLTTMKKL
jgi:hypothetical protein